mmetsp:Transcript_1045/g.1917  ORF Transcript_1045/g.1917 Transcript_1045/m.1917 type:complete len:109 (-) Transcript_1045:569-895(-)
MTFEQNPATKQIKSTLLLSNNQDQNIAYKIKTTAPKKFMVKPINGVLGPNRQISIDVQVAQEATGDTQDLLKNRFLIQSALTDLQTSEGFKIPKFWEDIDGSKDKKMS